MTAMLASDLPLPRIGRGKVRDIYAVGDDRVLLLATDRISGSAWKEFAASGTLAGEKLAPGLTESAKLDPAIFSPATKAETGHDENITVARMREVVGDEVAYELESMARAVYTLGEKLARDQGI